MIATIKTKTTAKERFENVFAKCCMLAVLRENNELSNRLAELYEEIFSLDFPDYDTYAIHLNFAYDAAKNNWGVSCIITAIDELFEFIEPE